MIKHITITVLCFLTISKFATAQKTFDSKKHKDTLLDKSLLNPGVINGGKNPAPLPFNSPFNKVAKPALSSALRKADGNMQEGTSKRLPIPTSRVYLFLFLRLR